jgi:hypothetical protein
MDRKGTIWSGAAILVVGLVVTLGSFAGASPGGSFVVATGAIFWGFVRLARGLGMQEDYRATDGSEGRSSGFAGSSKDARIAPLGEDRMPLIGGASCALCRETIASRLDGTACKACNEPLHHDCAKAHAAKCGGGSTAYRG